MNISKVQIITSKKHEREGFLSKVTTALNDGWTVIGYSVDNYHQYALLSKKGKVTKD